MAAETLPLLTLLTDSSAIWPSSSEVSKHLDHIRAFLADLSLDQATFVGRYSVTQADLIATMRENLPSLTGFARSLTSFILLFAQGIALSSRFSLDAKPPSDEEYYELESLTVSNVGIAGLLRQIYDIPDEVGGFAVAWETLRLHRVGTTSMIFRLERDHAPTQRLVLKVSHVLFTTVGPMASATKSYAADWQRISIDCPYIVRVWASGVGWVLEDFIDGPTLREFIDAYDRESDENPLLTRSQAYLAVLEAVAALHRISRGVGHGDLNPSNIILQSREASHPAIGNTYARTTYAARLIDMGRNLLASDTIGRVRSVDAKYVAPEVISMPPRERHVPFSADYYSLGHLLALCYGYSGNDGFYYLDENIYRNVPEVAKVAVRLLDESPARRVGYIKSLLHPAADKSFDFSLDGLGKYISDLTEILSGIEEQGYRSAKAGGRLLVQSIYGEISTLVDQTKLLRGLMSRKLSLDGIDRIGPARVLVSGFFYFLTLLIIAVSIANIDAGKSLGLAHLLGKSIHETTGQKAQIWFAGATFGVACFQYSVKAFGGVTFWRTSARLSFRVASEITLWLLTLVIFPCVVLSLALGYRTWPWFACIGLCLVSINNGITALARRDIDREIRLDPWRLQWLQASRVTRDAETEILAYWAPTLLAFSVFILVLALLSTFHIVHDFGIDAGAIALINIFVFSWAQVGRQGPILRGNLCQYTIAGENLALSKADTLHEDLVLSQSHHLTGVG